MLREPPFVNRGRKGAPFDFRPILHYRGFTPSLEQAHRVSGRHPMIAQQREDNHSRWHPGDRRGLYESFFLRGNDPEGARAFWIKFTVFAPRRRPREAEGELWAVFFFGTDGQKVAVKEVYPLDRCLFAGDRFLVRVGDAHLSEGKSRGACSSGGHTIRWDLRFPMTAPSLHFLPEWAYRSPVPKAKGLSPCPDLTWAGALEVNGRPVDVTGWRGSQNHNWGTRHTDRYAWAQCNVFQGAPDTYMEMMSARLRIGRFWTPPLSFLVLMHRGRLIRFNSLGAFCRARVRYPGPFEWHLTVDNGRERAHCRVAGRKETFAGLRYRNPPGGSHACLNSKISSSEIALFRDGRRIETLRSQFTTAFELLTDETGHGVPMLV